MKTTMFLFIVLIAIGILVKPIVAMSNDQMPITWETPFGEGGLKIPATSKTAKGDDSEVDLAIEEKADKVQDDTDGLTKVVAVIFPPDTNDILFVGERKKDKSVLFTPDSLSDALVVAYRGLLRGQAPGVSIDYTSTQEQCMYVRNKELHRTGKTKYKPCIEENDLLDIRYIGGDESTELGLTAFEADRIMKSLGLGKDNASKKPLKSNVSGFQTRLELSKVYPTGSIQTSHRFWIEPQSGSVERSDDGRTLVVKAKLWVDVRNQVATPSGMKDAEKKVEPAAAKFAHHMTEHYSKYGDEFPVFAKLSAFSQMTYAAQALLAANQSKNSNKTKPSIVDHEWMLSGYNIRNIDTKKQTPARVVMGQWKKKNGEIITSTITGGVDLTPTTAINDVGSYNKVADTIQKQALLAYHKRPRQPGIIRVGKNKYHVVTSIDRGSSELKSWQTDFKTGAIHVIRDYSPLIKSAKTTVGDWQLRTPAIVKISSEISQFKSGESVPSFIRIKNNNGEIITLDNYGKSQEPDQALVPSYSSRDGKNRILIYKDIWRYVNGKVEWRSRNGGSYRPVFIGDSHSIEFSSDENHHVKTVSSPIGVVNYKYSGDRISELKTKKGNKVRFKYLKNGLLDSVESNGGDKINYRYSNKNLLDAVMDIQGNSIEYLHESKTGKLQGMRAEFNESRNPVTKNAGYLVEKLSPEKEESKAIDDFKRRGINVIRLSYDANDNDVIRIGTKKIPKNEFNRTLTAILSKEGNIAKHKKQARAFFTELGSFQNPIIVTGAPNLRQNTAEMLRQILPAVTIATASQTTRALKLFNKSKKKKSEAELLVLKMFGKEEKNIAKVLFLESESFDNQATQTIKRYTKDWGSYNSVIVVGHNEEKFEKFVQKAAASGEFKGKSVILFTCGTDNLPGLIETVFESSAREVIYFRAPIKTKEAAKALATMQRSLTEGKTIQQIFHEMKSGTSVDKNQMPLFELMERQIGLVWPKRNYENLAAFTKYFILKNGNSVSAGSFT